MRDVRTPRAAAGPVLPPITTPRARRAASPRSVPASHARILASAAADQAEAARVRAWRAARTGPVKAPVQLSPRRLHSLMRAPVDVDSAALSDHPVQPAASAIPAHRPPPACMSARDDGWRADAPARGLAGVDTSEAASSEIAPSEPSERVVARVTRAGGADSCEAGPAVHAPLRADRIDALARRYVGAGDDERIGAAARALIAEVNALAAADLAALTDAETDHAEDRPGFAGELGAGVAVMRPPDVHDEGTEPPSRAEAVTEAEEAPGGTPRTQGEVMDDAGQGTDGGARADTGTADRAENGDGDARETVMD